VRPAAVLFDLDDTLIPEWPAIYAGWRSVAARVWGEVCSQRTSELEDAARQLMRETAPSQEYLMRVHFGLTTLLHGGLSRPGPESEAVRAYLPGFHRHAFESALPAELAGCSSELVDLWRDTRISALDVYPDTIEVLDRLAAHFPLALVTNGSSRLQRLKLKQTGLDSYFRVVVASEDIGVGKPDPAIFIVAAQQLAVAPASLVMVGNDHERDILGAGSAGIDAIWIQRDQAPAAPHRDLRQLPELLRW
jgi:putative hydrolase of the HAD superfamily